MSIENDSNTDDGWRQATTVQGLADLTARWLKGELLESYSYGGPPDEETAGIRDYLIGFNEGGFLTESSQPGSKLNAETGCAQRAFVEGFMREPAALRVAALALSSDLIVNAVQVSGKGGGQIPISIQGFEAITWTEAWNEECVESMGRYTPRRAFEDLKTYWYVSVLDPQWGREGYLWGLVEGALRGGGRN